MPPKASNQKRKRGRPPGASRVEQDASNNEAPVANDEPDAEEQARPRKRGRRSKTEQPDTAAGSTAQDSPAQPTRRGRRPKNTQQDATGGTEVSPEQRGKATGRKVKGASKESTRVSRGKGKAAQSHDAQAEDKVPSSEPRRSRRERQSSNAEEVSGSDRPASSKQGVSGRAPRRSPRATTGATPLGGKARPGKRSNTGKIGPKRGRPSLNNQNGGEGRALQPQQGNRAKAPSKASKQAKSAGSGGEGPQPKRRGRPRASNGSDEASEQRQPSESRAPVRRRPAEESEAQDEAPSKPKRKQAQPRRLEPVPEEAESSEPGEESELPFRHLREQAKTIPRSTITEKWNPLDGPSINAVGAFLADAQRPVLLRLQDTNRRREHASSALSLISRRLRNKLVKGFPFPAPTAGAPTRAKSGTHVDEFDFERTVDAVQTLESTLNPLQHSISLLEREIRREEEALARDYNSLHKLEANARSESKRWREQTKREHALVPGIRKKGDDGEWPGDSLELVPRAEEDAPPSGLFRNLQDEELDTMAKQIGSHMESMKGNLQQIGGVVPAIARSKAALQQVLLKHLDDEQYERVLVG